MINVLYNDWTTICSDLAPILRIVGIFVKGIQIVVPILLIIFGMMDLGKAVMAGKEDEMKKAQGTLIKRFIYAVAVFLVVLLVELVMGIVSDSGADTGNQSWIDCWNETA